MCGIVGFITPKRDDAIVEKMLAGTGLSWS